MQAPRGDSRAPICYQTTPSQALRYVRRHPWREGSKPFPAQQRAEHRRRSLAEPYHLNPAATPMLLLPLVLLRKSALRRSNGMALLLLLLLLLPATYCWRGVRQHSTRQVRPACSKTNFGQALEVAAQLHTTPLGDVTTNQHEIQAWPGHGFAHLRRVYVDCQNLVMLEPAQVPLNELQEPSNAHDVFQNS